MPETPDTAREIIEIKKEVRDIRQTQDAEIFHSRDKWEKLLWDTVGTNKDMMRVLTLIDGSRTKMKIEKLANISHATCWRYLDKLERAGIITRLESTKGGSPVFAKLRWYNMLRLDDELAVRTPVSQTVLSPSEQKSEQEVLPPNEERTQDSSP